MPKFMNASLYKEAAGDMNGRLMIKPSDGLPKELVTPKIITADEARSINRAKADRAIEADKGAIKAELHDIDKAIRAGLESHGVTIIKWEWPLSLSENARNYIWRILGASGYKMQWANLDKEKFTIGW